MHHQFAIEYWKDGEWFVGRLVEVTDVFSHGSTVEELHDNIRDAYAVTADESAESDEP